MKTYLTLLLLITYLKITEMSTNIKQNLLLTIGAITAIGCAYVLTITNLITLY